MFYIKGLGTNNPYISHSNYLNDGSNFHQKNWGVITNLNLNILYFITNIFPHCIAQLKINSMENNNNVKEVKNIMWPKKFHKYVRNLRGGRPLCLIGTDIMMAMCHSRLNNDGYTKYYLYFYLFKLNFEPISISPSYDLSFMGGEFQYPHHGFYKSDSNSICISVGISDCDMALLEIPIKEILNNMIF
jgi:hypothetical protein